jgi:hypothetical protein
VKIPEKYRTEIVMAIAILICILLGVGVFYAVRPWYVSRQSMKREHAELRVRIDKALQELRSEERVRAEYEAGALDMRQLSDHYVLQPVLGSFVLAARARLEPLADKTPRFEIINIREAPAKAKIKGAVKKAGSADKLKKAKGAAAAPAKRVYKGYGAEVTAAGGYEALTLFVRLVEESNPYLCITDLQVKGQPETPAQHKLVMLVEWPIEPPEEAEPAADGKGAAKSKAGEKKP